MKQKNRKRKCQPGRDDVVSKGDRARRTAATGPCKKASSGLVAPMMEMTDVVDRHWVGKPIPNSGLSTVPPRSPWP